jgi:hypothetical protein
MKNKKIIILFKNKFFLIKINNIIFFSQNLLETNNFVTAKTYTFLYILLILQKFGLKKNRVLVDNSFSGPVGLKISK